MLNLRPEMYLYFLLLDQKDVSYRELLSVKYQILQKLREDENAGGIGHATDGCTAEAFEEFRKSNDDILEPDKQTEGFVLKDGKESVEKCRGRARYSFAGIRSAKVAQDLAQIIKEVIGENKKDIARKEREAVPPDYKSGTSRPQLWILKNYIQRQPVQGYRKGRNICSICSAKSLMKLAGLGQV